MEPVGTTYQSARTDRPVRMTAAIRTSWRTSLRRAARFSGVKAMTDADLRTRRAAASSAALSSRHGPLHGPPRGLGGARCAAEARDLALSVPGRLRDRHHDPRVHVDLPEDGPSRLRDADRDVRSRPPVRGAEVPEGIRERLPEPRHLQRERREPRPRRSRARARSRAGWPCGASSRPAAASRRRSRLASRARSGRTGAAGAAGVTSPRVSRRRSPAGSSRRSEAGGRPKAR